MKKNWLFLALMALCVQGFANDDQEPKEQPQQENVAVETQDNQACETASTCEECSG